MVESIVLHSGGMDSSICLALAVESFGSSGVISVGMKYGQRHGSELVAAEKIASYFGVKRRVLELPPLFGWESSSLITHDLPIEGTMPNSFVRGRNGLFMMLTTPLIAAVEARELYVGVMELEGANSGYPDCSRAYIDSVERVMRIDLQDECFSVRTPLVFMTKSETMQLAHSMGVLDFLMAETVTCYNGLKHPGCRYCPACILRNRGLEAWSRSLHS